MADTSWANVGQAAEDAMATLRLKPGDIDEQVVARKAVEAAEIIAAFLDRPDGCDPIVDAWLLTVLRGAHASVTAELYLRKDAPFGVFDAFDQDASSYRIGADPLAGVRRALLPQKARWGLA